MPHCNYIGADCDHAANALRCKTVPAVECHERREQILKAREKEQIDEKNS